MLILLIQANQKKNTINYLKSKTKLKDGIKRKSFLIRKRRSSK